MAIRHGTTSASSSPAMSAAGAVAWDQDHTGFDLFANDSPDQNFDLSGGGTVTILSKSIPSIIAKDGILIEYWATILNNTGSGKAYTFSRSLGSFTTSIATGSLPTSATSRIVIHETLAWSVSATNLAYLLIDGQIATIATSTTSSAGSTGFPYMAWNTNTGNNTGTQTAVITCASSAASATQTFTLHSYKIWRAASAP